MQSVCPSNKVSFFFFGSSTTSFTRLRIREGGEISETQFEKRNLEHFRRYDLTRLIVVHVNGKRIKKKKKKKKEEEKNKEGKKLRDKNRAYNIDFERVRLLANKISSFKGGLVRGLFLDVPSALSSSLYLHGGQEVAGEILSRVYKENSRCGLLPDLSVLLFSLLPPHLRSSLSLSPSPFHLLKLVRPSLLESLDISDSKHNFSPRWTIRVPRDSSVVTESSCLIEISYSLTYYLRKPYPRHAWPVSPRRQTS